MIINRSTGLILIVVDEFTNLEFRSDLQMIEFNSFDKQIK